MKVLGTANHDELTTKYLTREKIDGALCSVGGRLDAGSAGGLLVHLPPSSMSNTSNSSTTMPIYMVIALHGMGPNYPDLFQHEVETKSSFFSVLAQIYIFTIYPGPKFTQPKFTQNPNLHNTKFTPDPNLHDPRFTPPQIYKTQIYTNPDIHSLNFTQNPNLHSPKFTQS